MVEKGSKRVPTGGTIWEQKGKTEEINMSQKDTKTGGGPPLLYGFFKAYQSRKSGAVFFHDFNRHLENVLRYGQ